MTHDRFRLDPTLLDRMSRAVRPGWVRSMLVRRVVAALLLAASVVAAIVSHRGEQSETVMIATRDLQPGSVLTGTDLGAARVDPDTIPAGALRMGRDGVGHTVTSPVHRGEVLTDWRLLGPRLPARLIGDSGARMVAVRLADDGVVGLLRAGDVVDVLTETETRGSDPTDGADRDAAPGTVLVRGAVVALVSRPDSTVRSSQTPVVMLAMRERDAHAVAGTALAAPVTVVFH